MTCQHCQTWNLDDDDRCRRCGRRVRKTPARISPETYPIAAAATAPAYEFEAEEEVSPRTESKPPSPPAQQPLFGTYRVEPRVIRFDSLTSESERESIRARAAELARPEPLKTGKVELRHARPRKPRSTYQTQLDFDAGPMVAPPQSDIICDAPVAPPVLRTEAALIDGLLVAAGWAFGAAMLIYEGGRFSLEKHILIFLAAALATVPLFYKILWTVVGRDTVGMRCMGLRLVDFDGNPPSQQRRYQRLLGSIISLLAAGMGLVWALVDEDNLTWHDHMSNTFPTIASELDS